MCNANPKQRPILARINSFPTSDIEEFLRNKGFELDCLIKFNLSAEKLNELNVELLSEKVHQEGITERTLLEAGMTHSRVERIFGIQNHPVSDPLPQPPAKSEPVIPSKTVRLLDSIRSGKALVVEIQDAMNDEEISVEQLRDLCGLDRDLIRRIKEYVPSQMSPVRIEDLPPLEPNRTDFYFLGLPSAGKTCLIASLLSYWLRKGLCNPEVKNPRSIEYLKLLGAGFSKGTLPMNNPNAFVDYIALTLNVPMVKRLWFGKKETIESIPINLLDMAGEKFKKVSAQGQDAFDSHKKYLQNENRKAIFFVLDFSVGKESDHGSIFEQNLSLITVLNNLEAMDILEKTDTVFLVVTKADLFPVSSDNAVDYAGEYIKSHRYLSFYNRLDELQKAHKFETKILPYSIGPCIYGQLLKDYDPATNENLRVYPELMSNEIIALTAKYKSGLF